MKKTLFALFSFGVFSLMPCTLFAQEPEVKIFKLITIEGTVFIKNNSLFLVDIANKAYQIKPELNPVDYNSLFAQVEAAKAKNKSINARILGNPAKSHSVIEYKFNYTEGGKEIASKKATETNYQDFDLVQLKSASEIEFREWDASLPVKKLPVPETPKPLPPMLKRSIGTVEKVRFNSAVPFIEVKDSDTGKVRAILTPSSVPTTKVVNGEPFDFETKKVIKEKMKIEVWYEQYGEFNTARSISILPD